MTGRLTADQQRMVLDNQGLIPLALSLLGPRGNHVGEDATDDVSAAQIGLSHAAVIFDPDKGAFSTIAVRCICSAVRQDRGLRRGLNYRWAVANREFWDAGLSLDAPIRARGQDGPECRLDVLADPGTSPDDGIAARRLVDELLASLSERDRITLLESPAVAAEILGISEASVRRRFYRIRLRLRAEHPELAEAA